MIVKCISVRLKSLVPVSAKAYIAEDFNGNSDFIPSSMVFGQDFDVRNSEAWWISEWILKKKKLKYSSRKNAEFCTKTRCREGVSIIKHVPSKVYVKNNPDEFKR